MLGLQHEVVVGVVSAARPVEGPSSVAASAAPIMPPPAAKVMAVGLDRGFLDAWFRCSSRRMDSANAASMVLALQALAVLQVGLGECSGSVDECFLRGRVGGGMWGGGWVKDRIQ